MEKVNKNKDMEKKIIGYRKTCKAQGTGLSHYILVDKPKTGALSK